MRDAKSNVHLRPYALYSLAIAIVCTAAVLLYTMLPGTANIQSLAVLETSGLWLLLSLTALAGANAHDALKVRKLTEVLGLATFILAVITLVLHVLRLGMYLQDSALYGPVSLIAIVLTVLCITCAVISSVLPTLVKKTTKTLFGIALIAAVSTAIATLSGIVLLFVNSPSLEIITLASAILAGMCVILLPILKHTLYVHKHIKSI